MAKLGSHERPAVVRVQSMETADEIVSLAEERGWQVIVGVEPNEQEDISDLRRLLRHEIKVAPKPQLPPKINGNDYCPCQSGKKFKKCCGGAASPAPS